MPQNTDYDRWLQSSKAYEEWAGIEEDDDYDEDGYHEDTDPYDVMRNGEC